MPHTRGAYAPNSLNPKTEEGLFNICSQFYSNVTTQTAPRSRHEVVTSPEIADNHIVYK